MGGPPERLCGGARLVEHAPVAAEEALEEEAWEAAADDDDEEEEEEEEEELQAAQEEEELQAAQEAWEEDERLDDSDAALPAHWEIRDSAMAHSTDGGDGCAGGGEAERRQGRAAQGKGEQQTAAAEAAAAAAGAEGQARGRRASFCSLVGRAGGAGASFVRLLEGEVARALLEARAQESGKARAWMLRRLAASLEYRLEAPVLELLDGAAPAGTRYYALLAGHYAAAASGVSALAATLVWLWSSASFPAVYCMLFHRWALEGGLEGCGGAGEARKHLHMLLKGANRLFWTDVAAGRARFRPVWHALRSALLAHRTWRPQESPLFAHVGAIFRLVSKFFFYYASPATAATFLQQVEALRMRAQLQPTPCASSPPPWQQSPCQDGQQQCSHRPGASSALEAADHSVANMIAEEEAAAAALQLALERSGLYGTAGVADIFVHATLRACEGIRNEGVLIAYLRGLAVFRLVELERRTAAVLFTTLQSFSNPGAPHYAPRPVRSAAVWALAQCFPGGMWARRLVKLGFRLLHPTQAVRSLVFYLLLLLSRLLLLLRGLFASLVASLSKRLPRARRPNARPQ